MKDPRSPRGGLYRRDLLKGAVTVVVLSLAADRSSGTDYSLGLFDFDFGRFGTDTASCVQGAQAIGFSGLVEEL